MQQPVGIKLENHIEARESNISNKEWTSLHPNDLWIYNKLEISRKLNYICGPCGVDVPRSNQYIVRPAINFCGMGRFSRIEHLDKSTDHLHPGEFWCEIFRGRHFSVDFYKKQPKLVVRGYKNSSSEQYKWSSWIKVDNIFEYPKILNDLKGDYSVINCEFIENKLIEVQIRQNLDFRWGNTVAIPVWKDKPKKIFPGYRFVEDVDYERLGFFIK